MKVKVIVIDAFGTNVKVWGRGLDELEIDIRAETILIAALLRLVRILRRVLETWGDLLSLSSCLGEKLTIYNDNNNRMMMMVTI